MSDWSNHVQHILKAESGQLATSIRYRGSAGFRIIFSGFLHYWGYPS